MLENEQMNITKNGMAQGWRMQNAEYYFVKLSV